MTAARLGTVFLMAALLCLRSGAQAQDEAERAAPKDEPKPKDM